MRLPFRLKRPHRREGDVYRSAGNWRGAADAYRRHVAAYPVDRDIWIQLGHAEKEEQAFDAAEQAYRRAAQIAPSDPEPWLHLGHMLKFVGRFDDAAVAFAALVERDPAAANTVELQLMTKLRRKRPVTAVGAGAVLFSLQDMFNMLAHHATASGIQRVQAGVALAVMADSGIDAHFIINDIDADDGSPAFLRLDEDDLQAVIARMTAESVNHADLRQTVARARMQATPITFGAGSTVVILGSFWDSGNGIDQYLAARKRGAKLVPFIHDIIPLTHPQFCDAGLTNMFWRRLAELLHASDYVLTNSDFTQAELTQFVTENGGQPLPMRTVRLAHLLARIGTTVTWPRSLAALKGRPYAAYVSTIEGRKNHLVVVQAWQQLIAQGVDVPDLLFVGREGWRAEPLMDLLRKTDFLDGRVRIVHGLSDAELNGVYANALFTLFTSVVEGWGLPVGESLAHGVPCVVTRAASLPEVGGDFVEYVEPGDMSDAVSTLRLMIEDGAYRDQRRRAIREQFVPRTWDDVGRDVVAALHAIADCATHPLTPVKLPEGYSFRPGSLQEGVRPAPGYFTNPVGLELLASFYPIERWGAWMRGSSGELTFRTDSGPGEMIVVLLSVCPAPWAIGGLCSVVFDGRSGGMQPWMPLNGGNNLVRIEGPVGADGSFTIGLRYRGAFRPEPTPRDAAGDPRHFALGLQAIGYAPLAMTPARVAIREDMLFA